MNEKNTYIENYNNFIENKVRGEISHYSINQVADLLNEDIVNIKYYTNIFDDLLHIEIVNKELEYKNEDINKLEYLIKLKNKGMTVKEIYEYYNKLSVSEAEVAKKTNNLLSVNELILEIINAQNNNFINLKNDIIKDIKQNNDEYLKNLSKTLIEKQEKSLNDFKNELYDEIKELLTENLNLHNEQSKKFTTDFLDKTNEFITEKISQSNKQFTLKINKYFDRFSNQSLTNNENMLKEIKSFKRVIQDAYYMNSELSQNDKKNKNLFQKLASLVTNN